MISLGIGFGFTTIVIGYPIFVLVLLIKQFKALGDEKMQQKFGGIYMHFRFQKSKTKVLEPFYSAVRRGFMAASFVFLSDYAMF